jgi:pyruvate kinase
MRRTKIIATVGPASSTREVLRDLLLAGVDVFRLNFSHGTHDTHAATCAAIRETASAVGRHVAVMQDLSGPKIRTGALEGGTPIQLEPGNMLRIAAGDRPGTSHRVYTPYAPLIASAVPGDRLLLDDGRIELRVMEAGGGEIVAVIVNGGALGPNKGINAPGVALPASAVTEKDEHDLRFGLALGVDLVALSFVQTAEDVHRGRALMRDAGRVLPIVAKIERPAAVDNLDEILAVADGLMVARGDLGLEMPLEQVPRVQKQVIRRTRAAGLPVILATQVLESMRFEPRPTRAEVSDAANAVEEGADAIMLAGETAAGAFPVRAVQTLDAVIRDAELLAPSEQIVPADDPTGTRHARALCEAAVTLASTARADAIVAVTRRGRTVRLLSSLRPRMPVYAATPSEGVVGSSALLWGVTPVLLPESHLPGASTPGSQTDALQQRLVEMGVLQRGCTVVFVNVNAELGRSDANFLKVRRIA